MEDKTLCIFGYEGVQDFSRTKVFDDIVGDLKIDALYIFDKTLLTTSFVVLKMINYNTKPLHIVEA
jgi:LytS/YehU family sensor histidine kinase